MPVLLAGAWLTTDVWTVLLIVGLCWWRARRRHRQKRWEAYIRDECALYIEEVLLAR